jgi:hypothetical protein
MTMPTFVRQTAALGVLLWSLAGCPAATCLLGGEASDTKPARDKAATASTAAADPSAPDSQSHELPSDEEDDGTPKDITFDDLKFEIEKGAPFLRDMLTEKIERMHGKRIRLRGYMLPSFQQRGIRQFVLVRDNMECCFGPGAALYDCVVIEMAPKQSTQFTVRPITVEGIFKIKELKGPDDKHLAIFEMLGESVK